MKKIIMTFVVFLLFGCSMNSTNYTKDKTFLGNIVDINGDMVLLLNSETYLTTVNEKYKDTLITTTKKTISKYHKLLDSHHFYKDDNDQIICNIASLNEKIDEGPINVSDELIEAINEAKKLTVLTKGYFNFTIGDLSNLYHDKFLPYDSNNDDPSVIDIQNTIEGIIKYDELDKYIIVDKDNKTIELKSKDNHSFSLDLGAFSKGYILNKIYEELIKYDTSFLLTAGASSIIAYSSEKEKIDWNVAINNPDNKGDMLLAFANNNGAISTSGDYENYYFLSDGTRRHHILNPYTGYSQNYYRSITLISSNACIVDALSTALFNVEDNKTKLEIINDIEKEYNLIIDYCFIKDGFDITINENFNNLLIKEYLSKDIHNIVVEN